MQIQKYIKLNPLLLFGIIVLGFILRIYHLDFQSLWNDELSTIYRSNYQEIQRIFKNWDDVHPPAQHILYFFWIKLFGIGEFSIRLPSVIAGVFSIYFIYLLAKKLYNTEEGIISAAFIAILWCPIYYSQEARQYAMLLLFSIITSYLLLFLIETFKNGQKLKLKILIPFIFSSILLAYYHYFGLLLITLQGFYLVIIFLNSFKKILKIAFIYSLVFIGYLPWFSKLLFYSNIDSLIFMQAPKFIDIIYYFEFLFNWSEPYSKLILLFYIYLLLLTIYRFFNTKKTKSYFSILTQAEVLLGLWLFVPFIIVFIKSNVSATIFTYRNLLISLPPAYILLARALTQLPFKNKIKYIVSIILIVTFLSDLFFSLNYYSKRTKDQFRESAKYIVDNNVKYENSSVIGYANNSEYINYYFKHFYSDFRANNIWGKSSDTIFIDNFIETNKADYLWYIYVHEIPDKDFVKYLSNHAQLIDSKDFIKSKVLLYKTKISDNHSRHLND